MSATQDDINNLAWTMLGEANPGDIAGMTAVGSTVMNRLNSGRYGSTITKIVKGDNQYAAWGIGSQAASQGNNPDTRFPVGSPQFEAAKALAQQIVDGKIPDNTGGAVEYRQVGTSSKFSEANPGYVNIGGNVFKAGSGATNTADAALGYAPSSSAPQNFYPGDRSGGSAWDPMQATYGAPPSRLMPPSKPYPGDLSGGGSPTLGSGGLGATYNVPGPHLGGGAAATLYDPNHTGTPQHITDPNAKIASLPPPNVPLTTAAPGLTSRSVRTLAIDANGNPIIPGSAPQPLPSRPAALDAQPSVGTFGDPAAAYRDVPKPAAPKPPQTVYVRPNGSVTYPQQAGTVALPSGVRPNVPALPQPKTASVYPGDISSGGNSHGSVNAPAQIPRPASIASAALGTKSALTKSSSIYGDNLAAWIPKPVYPGDLSGGGVSSNVYPGDLSGGGVSKPANSSGMYDNIGAFAVKPPTPPLNLGIPPPHIPSPGPQLGLTTNPVKAPVAPVPMANPSWLAPAVQRPPDPNMAMNGQMSRSGPVFATDTTGFAPARDGPRGQVPVTPTINDPVSFAGQSGRNYQIGQKYSNSSGSYIAMPGGQFKKVA